MVSARQRPTQEIAGEEGLLEVWILKSEILDKCLIWIIDYHHYTLIIEMAEPGNNALSDIHALSDYSTVEPSTQCSQLLEVTPSTHGEFANASMLNIDHT